MNKAKIYSDTMHMSKQGIYDQLTSDAGEKFKEKDANYAIEHLKANYKENAKKKAKDYVEQQNMSKDAVFNQLTSSYGEKFTKEEAQYAVDHLEK
ncbi:Ltp family lipoprotein [Staphylococcus capitis]|uniref:Ltp family lipoprotein n=1 Tax=Staphylococcus TaxID=1279 RepID=UPI0001EF4C4C|nr:MULTISPECIES: Ltp family lipoprotein [Staphylococcus]EFS17137.1 surface lipoprotein-related protein [Staphylococcus capitis C87]MDH9929566.1 Ltp family lipoprotein [Staphylococcus capitis]MDH9975529.1 Ltp family lipoprotein [Staphylococcus capitis]MDI0006118.1 Ltp family lipoprotein [Staphylococcus capitis]MDI0027791.1 Ltp family lipoprotein [Staphylococcus capitis]